jgi:hypothetical protein
MLVKLTPVHKKYLIQNPKMTKNTLLFFFVGPINKSYYFCFDNKLEVAKNERFFAVKRHTKNKKTNFKHTSTF